MSNKSDEQDYSPEEATRRMNEALRRALTTPPKPQKEIVGKTSKAMKRRRTPNDKAVKSDQ